MAVLSPPEVQIPPPPGRPGGWGELLENTLIRFFGRLINTARDAFTGVIRAGFELFLEAIEPALISLTVPVIDLVLSQGDVPPEVRRVLEDMKAGKFQAGSFLLQALGGSAVGTVTGNVLQTLLANTTYGLNRKVQPARLDFGTLWRARNRSTSPVPQFMDDLADQGWSSERLGLADLAAEVRPGVPELMTLWLRGEIDSGVLTKRLIQEGVPAEYIAEIQKLAWQIPSSGDLVRFALREVWRDDLRGQLLSPDAPGRYYELMEKSGFSRDFAADYWAAHWALPGVSQGFEMFYRLPGFTEKDLRQLLTRLDILPAYHDELIAIAYNTLTRVDVRRMYGFGILNEDQVYQSYLEQGNTPENARHLTDLAIADATQEDRDLTKADVLNGYRDGILSHGEAQEMLVSIDFSPESASFLLARVDSQAAQKLVDAEVRVIKDLYLNGDLSQAQMVERLTALGLPSRQIELYSQEWLIDREGKVKRPSRETLERLYKSGAITLDDFTTTLAAIGYQDKYIDWYLRNIAIEREAETLKESERARKEKERADKDKRSSAYQRDKAGIDVEIAEVQAAIAAAEVALVEAQNDKAEALRAALPLDERARIEHDYMVLLHDADAAIGEAKIAVSDLKEQEKVLRSRLAEIDQSLATNVDVTQQVAIKAAIATMRTEQARFRDVAAAVRVDKAKLEQAIAVEGDPMLIEQMEFGLLALNTQEKEADQAVTDIEIDVREAQEQLGVAMAEVRRYELLAEQASVRIEIAGVAERIVASQSDQAETQVAKTNARNAMEAELTALPGAAQELDIRKRFDTLIEDIKAQIKGLRVTLSNLRVQKALLTFEYRAPTD